jgi:hypothetical protein
MGRSRSKSPHKTISTTPERFTSPAHRMWGGWVELWDLVWATGGLHRDA